MADLVLHIGMPKTGTTSVQGTLVSQRAALARFNAFYAPLGRNHGAALARSFLPRTEGGWRRRLQAELRPARAKGAEALAELERLAAQHPDGTFIVSAEAMSAMAPPWSSA